MKQSVCKAAELHRLAGRILYLAGTMAFINPNVKVKIGADLRFLSVIVTTARGRWVMAISGFR